MTKKYYETNNEGKKFIWTKPKLQIAAHIYESLNLLLSNDYLATPGNASKLIVGQEGIGKSTALESIVVALQQSECFSRLIPVYSQQLGQELVGPVQAIRQYLLKDKNNENTHDFPEGEKISDLVKWLKKKDLYALIVIDKLEEVYAKEQNFDHRISILHQLQALETQTSGRVYTLICVSSQYIYSLITKQALRDANIVSQFPLVKSAPSLNGDKFNQIRLDAIANIEDFKRITEAYGIGSDFINLFFFVAGNNFRQIQDVLDKIKKQQLDSTNEGQTLASIAMSFSGTEPDDQGKSKDRKQLLIQAINNNLLEKNKKFLQIVEKRLDALKKDDSKAYLQVLKDTEWLSSIESLDRYDLAKIKYELELKNNYEFKQLIDDNLFSGNSEQIYPRTGCQLYALYLSETSKIKKPWPLLIWKNVQDILMFIRRLKSKSKQWCWQQKQNY